MSTWLHCDLPEPHAGHSWQSRGIDEYDLPWRSEHTCPGVKNTNEMHVLMARRDRAAAELKECESTLRAAAVRYRRTPHQYTVSDNTAPAEEPRED